MKEIYNAPAAELIVFAAMEMLATGEHQGIPYNDEPPVRAQPGVGGSGLTDAPW